MATRAAVIGPPARRRRRALVRAATAIGVAVLAAALAAFLWLRTYAPLAWDGGSEGPLHGIVRTVEPAPGSDGKTVYFARPAVHSSSTIAFDVTNTGRFSVRVDRVATGRLQRGITPAISIVGAGIEDHRTLGRPHPFVATTVDPGKSLYLVVRYETACSPESLRDRNGSLDASIEHVTLRYTYLGIFHREQTVETPYGLTLQCGGKLPASTPVP